MTRVQSRQPPQAVLKNSAGHAETFPEWKQRIDGLLDPKSGASTVDSNGAIALMEKLKNLLPVNETSFPNSSPEVLSDPAKNGIAPEPAALLGKHLVFVQMLLCMASKLDTDHSLYNIRAPHAQAYYEEKPEAQFLFFRGTKDLDNLWTDLEIAPVERKNLGSLHKGFADQWGILKPPTMGNLRGKQKKPLYIGGHSLGGAVATIAALDLKKRETPPYKVAHVVTMASPEAGDRAWQRNYRRADIPTLRFTLPKDQVPKALGKIPGMGIYRHVGNHISLNVSGPGTIDSHALKYHLMGVHDWLHGEKTVVAPSDSSTAPVSFQSGGPVFGGRPVVEALKRGLSPGALPGYSFSPSGVNKLARAKVIRNAQKNEMDVRHNTSVTVNMPSGTPAEHRKILEETARNVVRNEILRGIEHVYGNNPQMKGV